MRKLVLFVAAMAVSCLGSVVVRGESLTPEEQAFLDKNITQFIKIEPDRLHGLGLDQVFKAPFYNVDVKISDGSGTQTVHLVLARVGDKLVAVSDPGTDTDLPQLKQMINPQFKLHDQKDAQAVQEALDVLYPISSSFGGEDLKAKAIKHNGDQWIFVRGKFIDKHKGYVFTTDSAGSITGVKYSLNLP